MEWINKNLVWVMLGGVVFLFLLNLCLIWVIDDPNWRGTFGDQFGAVNALFSGLAFTGLIYTIILQRRDLEIQRNDLRLQRDELKQTRKEFEEQNMTMKRQRFENTFFNLMSLHQHITDNLEYECSDGADPFKVKGREVFKKFYLEKDNFDGSRGVKGYLEAKTVDNLFGYSDFEVFNHYFHFFDGILSYIDRSDLIENTERYQYSVMLRNTLSDNERYLMFYYYIACGGWHKTIAEEYALFYDVLPNELSKEEHYLLFEAGAYNHFIA